MDSKAWTVQEYKDTSLSRVKSGCLQVFHSLGALQEDLILIGGLAPALLVDQTEGKEIQDPSVSHVGTRDVDIGISLGIVEEQTYDRIPERLRQSGFKRDKNKKGNSTNHR